MTDTDIEPVAMQCVSTVDGLRALEAEWRDLALRDGRGTTWFQSADWCLAWAAAYLDRPDDKRQIRVHTFRKNGRLAALLPLMEERKYGLRRLVPLGFPDSQYADCLMDRDTITMDEMRFWLRNMLDRRQADCLSFDDMPAGSPLVELVSPHGTEFNAGGTTMVMDFTAMDDIAALDAAFSKRMRKNRRSRMRKLEEKGAVELAIHRAGTRDYRDLLQTALAWKRDWLAEKGHPISPDREKRWRMLLAGLRSHEDGDCAFGEGAVMSVLTVGGQPVAIEIGFIQARHYYCYMGAYSAEWADLSPGKVQMYLTMQWALEQGIATFDLLGAADYKASNSNLETALASRVLPMTWKGTLFATAWLGHLRPALYRAFTAAGPAIKGPVVKMREMLNGGGAERAAARPSRADPPQKPKSDNKTQRPAPARADGRA